MSLQPFFRKVFLITGSSSGLGAATAAYLGARGARLSLTGRDGRKLDNVHHTCLQAGVKSDDVMTQTGELTDDKFRRQLVASTVDKFGQLDVLVNNAAVARMGPLSDPGMEDYSQVLNINLHSQVAMSKLATPHLLRSKGNIVNVSSVASFRPGTNAGLYCMSKAALDMFTKVMALELAPQGVRVNSVNPGFVQTDLYRFLTADEFYEAKKHLIDLHPVGRLGKPEEIARAIAFLASDQSSFITGELLVIDGGMSLGGTDPKLKED